jgi:hypothetical protein
MTHSRFFRLVFPLLLALCGAGRGFSQDLTQTVRGVVTDADTQTPLIGAEVLVIGSDPLIGTVTDGEGAFSLAAIPVGRISLQITYLGYERTTAANILVHAGRETVLRLSLREAATELGEVVVKAYSGNGRPTDPMALVSTRSISMEEMNRLATGFNDPALITANFAGVATAGNGGNDIIVRGNSPKYLQWRLEGMPITNPNHFADQGAVLGSTGILNSNLLATADFYTGAFPAEFGNALAGAYDLRLRNGNSEKLEAILGVGLLGTDLTLEGPLKAGYAGSFLVNYRYSTAAILNRAGLLDVAGNPQFQDGAFKLHLPTQNWGTFSLFGIGGTSQFALVNATPADWDTPGDDVFRGTVYEDYDKASHLYNAGINHTIALSASSYLRTSLAASFERIADDVFQKPDSLGPRTPSFVSELDKVTYRARTTYHRKIDRRHTLQAGVLYTSFDQRFDQRRRFDSDGPLQTLLDFDERIGNLNSFVSWKYRPHAALTLVGGLHNNNVFFNSKHTLEPRLSARWQLSEPGALSFGYGLHSTMESPHHYFARIDGPDGNAYQPNRDLDLLKAHHLVLGYEHRFTPQLVGKVEAYYQSLFDLPVANSDTSHFATINEGAEIEYYDLVNAGTGRNYGVELSLQRYFHDDYYFLVNASLYESTYRTLEGITRQTRFDGQYLLNVIGGREFTGLGRRRNRTLGLNAKFQLRGGQPILPLLRDDQGGLAVDPEAGRYWDYDRAYTTRLDKVYQLTLSASYKIERAKTTHELFLNLENLTGRQGRLTEYYDAGAPDGVGHTTQFGLLPNLLYRVYF